MEPTAGLLITPSVRLRAPLGGGGMGSVWLADHLSLETTVVVKFIASAQTTYPNRPIRLVLSVRVNPPNRNTAGMPSETETIGDRKSRSFLS